MASALMGQDNVHDDRNEGALPPPYVVTAK